jgi:hypothetical protein
MSLEQQGLIKRPSGGRKRIVSIGMLQWAEADCARLLRCVKDGTVTPDRHERTVFVYAMDPTQRKSFDSRMAAWVYSQENDARQQAMSEGWYEDWVVLGES